MDSNQILGGGLEMSKYMILMIAIWLILAFPVPVAV